jgi:hypothetical protein
MFLGQYVLLGVWEGPANDDEPQFDQGGRRRCQA